MVGNTQEEHRRVGTMSHLVDSDFQTKMKVAKFDTQVRVFLRNMHEVVRKPGATFLKNNGYISSLTP
jgi:hypothetical protein